MVLLANNDFAEAINTFYDASEKLLDTQYSLPRRQPLASLHLQNHFK
jgi:hypothetical protein